jgi:thiol-disulfide isomerase/thioredoxin
MKKILLLLFFAFQISYAQSVEVVKFDDLQEILKNKTETTYIINFWATWCKPCVAELPHFETLANNFRQNKIKVLLVSLDFAKDIEKVREFVKHEKIISDVVLLNETDANKWINLIDNNWSGAIPATIMLNEDKRQFFEHDFNYTNLASTLKTFLQ